MKRILMVGCALGLFVAEGGNGGEDVPVARQARAPERLGAHWARVSDRAQIELVVDNLRSAAQGRRSERMVRGHVAQGLNVASLIRAGDTQSLSVHAGSVTFDVDGIGAKVLTSLGDGLVFRKTGDKWKVTGGKFSAREGKSHPSAPRAVAGEVSEGETFIVTPVSREYNIDRLSRGLTSTRIDRKLFGAPEKSASYYHVRYMQRAPYVEATYIQFVTDPAWDRVIYGSLNRWIKAYENLSGPSAIAVDADGRVFIGESGKQRIVVLRIVGEGDAARLEPVFTIDGITSPNDIAHSDNGTPLDVSDDVLYVADAVENKIIKYALGATGAVMSAAFDGFDGPLAIAVGRWNGANNGLLYVVDRIAKRIRLFDEQETGLSFINEIKGDYSQYLKSIKTDHFGNVYVVDHVNSRLMKYTSSLDFLDAQGGGDMFAMLAGIDIPFGKIVVEGEGTYWAGFDQLFALERWAETTGAQRRVLGLALKNIRFTADDDISRIESGFTLTDFGNVSLRVFDSGGQLVRDLGSFWMVSGQKSIQWNRRNDHGAQVRPGNYRFDIAGKSAYRNEATVSRTEFYLPLYYWQNSGSLSPADDAHLVQGSPVSWGTFPAETANEHESSVQYRFTGLNPASKYAVEIEFAAQDGRQRLQEISVDGLTIHPPFAVTAAPSKSGYLTLPPETYADGEATISVNRRGDGSAIVTQLWFKEQGVGLTPHQVKETIPTSYVLDQNYPNPFNPSTVIRFSLPSPGNVSLKVFDITGREVSVLVDDRMPSGTHEVRFDVHLLTGGKTLASGIYLYRLTAGEFTEAKKMLLLK